VDGANVTVKKFYSIGMSQIAVRTNGELNWILTDHLSSASVSASVDGTLVSEVKYTVYGEIRPLQGTLPTKYTYTGQLSQMDEIGLLFFVARWADPLTGHFVQADTIVPSAGNAVTYNRFAYARYNPIKYNDPSGHDVGCAGMDASKCGTNNQSTSVVRLPAPKFPTYLKFSPATTYTPKTNISAAPPPKNPTLLPATKPEQSFQQVPYEKIGKGVSVISIYTDWAPDLFEGLSPKHTQLPVFSSKTANTMIGFGIDAFSQYISDSEAHFGHEERLERAFLRGFQGGAISLVSSGAGAVGGVMGGASFGPPGFAAGYLIAHLSTNMTLTEISNPGVDWVYNTVFPLFGDKMCYANFE
jgi:RHS repeat-associated protein